jgi:hypothetical protein
MLETAKLRLGDSVKVSESLGGTFGLIEAVQPTQSEQKNSIKTDNPQRVLPLVALPLRPVTNQNTDFQSRFMLTTTMPYSAALSSASTSGLNLNSRS